MLVDALEFSSSSREIKPKPFQLDLQDLERLHKDSPAPRAYLVKRSQLEKALEQVERPYLVVKQQGGKGKRVTGKHLGRILLKEDMPEYVAFDYKSKDQVARSLYDLLGRAAVQKCKKGLYIVGVKSEYFDYVAASKGARSVDTDKCRKVETFAGIPLNHVEVPQDLRDWYLGESDDAQHVRQLIMIASSIPDPALHPVLILGETGTGKNRIAEEIHRRRSGSRPGPMVTVNCAAIPSELLEGELFGYEPGAFTGAERLKRAKRGKWELAHGGTLFLDEIGDLHLDHQVKILNALQDRAITRIGAEKPIENLDVAVIAATDRDLDAMIAAGTFREVLYYRLCQLVIRTPSFRDHPEDIEQLSQKFWGDITGKSNLRLRKEVIDRLKAHSWPGGVRELKSLLYGLFFLFREENPGRKHLEAHWRYQHRPMSATGVNDAVLEGVEGLRHLRRVGEVARACRKTFGATGAVDTESVRIAGQFHYHELDTLCYRGERMPNDELRSAVRRLTELVRLVNDGLTREGLGDVQDQWQERVAASCDEVLSLVEKEIPIALSRI
jgi:DNA-binding NtrC family response regulator